MLQSKFNLKSHSIEIQFMAQPSKQKKVNTFTNITHLFLMVNS